MAIISTRLLNILMFFSEYWRGLAAGTYFADRRLDACIDVIHRDIVGIWNFRDDDEVSSLHSFARVLLKFDPDLRPSIFYERCTLACTRLG